jgi:hypothetical protein
MRTRSLAEHCRVLRALDSKIGRLRFLCWRGTLRTSDHASARYGSYVRRHPVRLRASQPDNKSRVCKDQSDVAGEICSPQSCDSVDAAKESVHSQLPFCEVSWHASQPIHLIGRVRFREARLAGMAHPSPLHLFPHPKGGSERGWSQIRFGTLRSQSAEEIMQLITYLKSIGNQPPP